MSRPERGTAEARRFINDIRTEAFDEIASVFFEMGWSEKRVRRGLVTALDRLQCKDDEMMGGKK